ncbi:hypothetical protein [Natronobacterium gregoryi]|uniref:Uncharacterized protein n=2 Tax=Natronobacterium gregoryi TaxID=44930 RepID=L0AMP7_NATGS|nr:hypothetical protein [Natronobacterium gregoryi]AFZ74734.1 hypothetical protein Natgr_3622 [Natronobacterium gregoryi SP2]ELY73458.1 hypothetical protein C490_01295 [Natronobacterium gregoryi SP2]SFJ03799.1 hypothetical protein SAMN05443661_11223 [Natronobacterium gregoryi]
MISRAYHATLFALYQLCIVTGILVMPVAIAARQAGVTLPVHRLITNVENAYESAQTTE